MWVAPISAQLSSCPSLQEAAACKTRHEYLFPSSWWWLWSWWLGCWWFIFHSGFPPILGQMHCCIHCILLQDWELLKFACSSWWHSKLINFKLTPGSILGQIRLWSWLYRDALVAISTGSALILLKVGILLKGPNVLALPTNASSILLHRKELQNETNIFLNHPDCNTHLSA